MDYCEDLKEDNKSLVVFKIRKVSNDISVSNYAGANSNDLEQNETKYEAYDVFPIKKYTWGVHVKREHANRNAMIIEDFMDPVKRLNFHHFYNYYRRYFPLMRLRLTAVFMLIAMRL